LLAAPHTKTAKQYKAHQNTKKPTKIRIFSKREWKCVCTYVANWEPRRALSCAAPLVGWIRKIPKNTPKKTI
jgi:hypothetical protein